MRNEGINQKYVALYIHHIKVNKLSSNFIIQNNIIFDSERYNLCVANTILKYIFCTFPPWFLF